MADEVYQPVSNSYQKTAPKYFQLLSEVEVLTVVDLCQAIHAAPMCISFTRIPELG